MKQETTVKFTISGYKELLRARLPALLRGLGECGLNVELDITIQELCGEFQLPVWVTQQDLEDFAIQGATTDRQRRVRIGHARSAWGRLMKRAQEQTATLDTASKASRPAGPQLTVIRHTADTGMLNLRQVYAYLLANINPYMFPSVEPERHLARFINHKLELEGSDRLPTELAPNSPSGWRL